MKRFTAALLLVLLTSNVVLAEVTDYEKKLEYKRKKIMILVKTRTIGETNAYSNTDSWSNTISPEAGYSTTYTSARSTSGSTFGMREISDWVVIRGGVREMNDVDLLEVTGHHAEARDIEAKIDDRDRWRTIGTIAGITGLIVAIAGTSAPSSGPIVAGAVVSIVGFAISSFNYSPKHFIAADYALELTDKYNVQLKKDLGIPVDFE